MPVRMMRLGDGPLGQEKLLRRLRNQPVNTYDPSDSRVVDAFFALPIVQSGKAFVDLGCGDGQMVLGAAKAGMRATGVEIQPLLFRECEIKARSADIGEAPTPKFIFGDLMEFDFSGADVVWCYLFPETLGELKPKFSQLKSGSHVVSNTFEIPGWKPTESIFVSTDPKHKPPDTYLQVYRVP